MKKSVLLILLTLFLALGFAQNVQFNASGPSEVAQGNRFKVIYSINKDGRNFKGPDFKGFRVLSGPNPSSNTSIEYVNGKMSKRVSNSYTYFLQAKDAGKIHVRPASIRVDGKLYNSNSLTINVKKGSQTRPQKQNNQNKNSNSSAQAQNAKKGKDVFIKGEISSRNPYLGEQIILTYRIFTKVGIAQYEPQNGSTFPGFWVQDLVKKNQRAQQKTEYINGEEYISAELKRVALFPMKSGEIKIDPYRVKVIAQYRKKRSRSNSNDPFDSFFNDSFFNMGVENVELNVESKAFNVKVKPLPIKDKPADFTGAVGKYSLTSLIDRQELNANDAITLKYTISGKGNIPLLKLPKLDFHSDLEAFDPKISQNVKHNNSGISGKISFEYLIIPRSAGDFEIPAMNFSYFDTSKKKYVTLTADAYPLVVKKATGQSTGISYSAVSQEDVKYIGSDIRHIRLLPFEVNKKGLFFFASPLFFTLIFVPIFLLIIVVILIKRWQKQHGNLDLMRNRKATKIARKRLKKAQEAFKNNNSKIFFDEVSMALWGYLSDKFTIPRSELSMETVNDRLQEKGVGEEPISKIILILENCEFARFAPSDKTENMEQTYKDAIAVISNIEQGLK